LLQSNRKAHPTPSDANVPVGHSKIKMRHNSTVYFFIWFLGEQSPCLVLTSKRPIVKDVVINPQEAKQKGTEKKKAQQRRIFMYNCGRKKYKKNITQQRCILVISSHPKIL